MADVAYLELNPLCASKDKNIRICDCQTICTVE